MIGYQVLINALDGQAGRQRCLDPLLPGSHRLSGPAPPSLKRRFAGCRRILAPEPGQGRQSEPVKLDCPLSSQFAGWLRILNQRPGADTGTPSCVPSPICRQFVAPTSPVHAGPTIVCCCVTLSWFIAPLCPRRANTGGHVSSQKVGDFNPRITGGFCPQNDSTF